MIRTIHVIAISAVFFIIGCAGIVSGQTPAFINQQTSSLFDVDVQSDVPQPVADPATDVGEQASDELMELAQQIRKDGDEIKAMADEIRTLIGEQKQANTDGLGGAGFVQSQDDGPEIDGDTELERRVMRLEQRMDAVEEKLQAMVTVKTADGTETTEEVEIDQVAGYGDFEVPKGGKVTAINGVKIYRASPTIVTTPSFWLTPALTTTRTVRIVPRPSIARPAASAVKQVVAPRSVSPLRAAASPRYYVDADGCTVDRVTGKKVSCQWRP